MLATIASYDGWCLGFTREVMYMPPGLLVEEKNEAGDKTEDSPPFMVDIFLLREGKVSKNSICLFSTVTHASNHCVTFR